MQGLEIIRYVEHIAENTVPKGESLQHHAETKPTDLKEDTSRLKSIHIGNTKRADLQGGRCGRIGRKYVSYSSWSSES